VLTPAFIHHHYSQPGITIITDLHYTVSVDLLRKLRPEFMVFGRILDFLDLILVNEEFFVNAEDFPLPEEVIDAKM
jgi:hypothetical protein